MIGGYLKGISIFQGVKEMDHSQFVNVTLLMGETSLNITSRFKKLLDKYMEASRGKINKAKSNTYNWNTPPLILQRKMRISKFSCTKYQTSFRYLGILIALPYPKVAHQKHILQKKKMQQWGSHWLNPVGRSVLIGSFLITLPLYQIYVCLTPMGIMTQTMKEI